MEDQGRQQQGAENGGRDQLQPLDEALREGAPGEIVQGSRRGR